MAAAPDLREAAGRSKPLLTIVQISDLHIGEIDPGTGDAKTSKIAAKAFAQMSWFDGVLGHNGRALQDLEGFVAQFEEREGPFQLLVTGDVTRCGGPAEFEIANEFLSGQVDLTPPGENWCGLLRGPWTQLAIPGNHDHWSGRAWPFGGPTSGLGQYFSPARLPYVVRLTLDDRRELQVAGINTDADIGSKGLQRLGAVGSFQTQLAALAPQLGPKKDGVIRALAMHHSWHKGRPLLFINSATRAALAKFLEAHQIQVVLTGHTHEPLVKPFSAGSARVMECRCGSTTQHDQVPYAWVTLFSRFPIRNWPRNTLLVHRILGEQSRLIWNVQTYTRTPDRGFQPLRQGSRSFGFLT